MLKEIGKIMKDPVVSFLIKKDPIEKIDENNPSDKLSKMLSEKMLEEKKKKLKEEELIKEKKEEDLYYEELQKRIKEEIRNKGSFDFSKLPDKDRQMLAQRKVYNKIGLKVYENYTDFNNDKNINLDNNDNIKDKKDFNNNNSNKINIEKAKNIDINKNLENQMKNEINREEKRDNFLKEIEQYKEEEDDYFNIDKLKNKEKENLNKYDNNEKDKIKPTARDILEKVLKKIEYKNEQLINHNEANEAINLKKENNYQKRIKNY